MVTAPIEPAGRQLLKAKGPKKCLATFEAIVAVDPGGFREA